MRRLLLSMMILAATVVSGFAADTYTPLVREGVEWGYVTQEYGKISYHRLRFYGSEIVNGKEYHKLVAYTSYNGEYDKVPMAWMREENRKVYCIYLDTPLANDFIGSRNPFTLLGTYPKQEEIMIFDFSLKKGDKFSLPDVGDFTCTETGYMDVADGKRQYWKLGGICWGLDYALFVEGMGPVFLNCSWGASILVPYHFETTGVPDFTKRDFLLYEREYNGYMGLDIAAFRGKDIYKSPLYDKYGIHDPSVWDWAEYDPKWDKINEVEAPEGAFSFAMGADGVKVTGAAAELARVKVYDLAGREHMSVRPLDGRVSIPYTLLPAGVAIVRAEAPDGASRSLKVAVRARD